MNQPLDEDVSFLEHYGVKGQKWGVRKKYESSDREGAGKESSGSNGDAAKIDGYLAANNSQEASKTDQAKSLGLNKQKFAAKFDDSPKKGSSKSETTPIAPDGEKYWTNKKIAKVALGVGVAGLLVYAAHKGLKYPEPNSIVDASQFTKATTMSQIKTWTGAPPGAKMINAKSFMQEEFTLPVGHEFHRISTSVETGFRGATYSVSSKEDFNRYVAGFRAEKGKDATFYHTTFKATSEIKVPSLLTRLEAMKEVALEERARDGDMFWGVKLPPVDDNYVLKAYKQELGGNWDSPSAKSFFSKLAEKGYHAIIDDMDAGVIGDKPLVMFDPKALSKKTASLMDTESIRQAESALLELTNRK